jgi:hypothetical protein
MGSDVSSHSTTTDVATAVTGRLLLCYSAAIPVEVEPMRVANDHSKAASFTRYAISLCALVLFASCGQAAAALDLQLVAIPGDPAPGGGTYSSVNGRLSINDSHLAFSGLATGGSISSAIFVVDSAGNHSARVVVGDPAPGTVGGSFERLSSPRLTASGDIGFHATVTGGTTSEGLFVVDSNGTTSVRAVLGQAAPGGGIYFRFLGWSINAMGDLAFWTPTFNPLGSSGIFVADSTGTSVARVLSGQPAPTDVGGTMTGLNGPSINDAGDTVFVGIATGGTATRGIFVADAVGNLSTLVLLGQTAPNTGGGVYSIFSSVHATAAGGSTFLGTVTGGTTTGGIFGADSGGIHSLVLTGDPAPGTGGGTYSGIATLKVATSGAMSFKSNIAGGPTYVGIFAIDTVGTHHSIVLRGQSAPGTGGGTFGGQGQHAISPSGDVALSGIINDGAISEAIHFGTLRTAKLPALSWVGLLALAMLHAVSGVRVLGTGRAS